MELPPMEMKDFPSDPGAYVVSIRRALLHSPDRDSETVVFGVTIETAPKVLLHVDGEAAVQDFLGNAWEFSSRARDTIDHARADDLPPEKAMILCAMDVMGIEVEVRDDMTDFAGLGLLDEAVEVVGHTPGPWLITPCVANHGETTCISVGDGFEIAGIKSPAWDDEAKGEYAAVDRANARLIAAALDMLVVLRDLESTLTALGAKGNPLKRIRAAIAKATRAAEMLALADRCEAARGPDRELDRLIGEALNAPIDLLHPVPRRFTDFIDAVLKLKPEGTYWILGSGRMRPDEPLGGAALYRDAAHDEPIAQGEAATPPLAMCAAVLRAHVALEKATGA